MRRRGDENYAEFIPRERGTDENPALTLEIKTPTYNEQFRLDLKAELPYGARVWDGVNNCWRILPMYEAKAVEIAKRHFPHVYKTVGERTEDLTTGAAHEQGGLF